MHFCFVNVNRKSNKKLYREFYSLGSQNTDNNLVSQRFAAEKSV